MEQYLTEGNIVIVALVFWVLVQSKYFATKLDIANLKLELQQYSDAQDKCIMAELDELEMQISAEMNALRNLLGI